MPSASGRPPARARRRSVRSRRARASGSETGASPTRWTERSRAAAAAASSASRLLPAPPWPVIVTSRTSGRARSGSIVARSSCRPDEAMVERGQRCTAERRQRWERRLEVRRDELEERVGSGHVLQAMPAERLERDPARVVVADEVARRARDDDLATVRGGADPRRDDDVHADVSLVPEVGLARVDADAHAQSRVRRPWLACELALEVDRRQRHRHGRCRRRGTRRRPAQSTSDPDRSAAVRGRLSRIRARNGA